MARLLWEEIIVRYLFLSLLKQWGQIGRDFYNLKEQGRLIVEDRGGELDYDRVIPKIIPIFGLVGVCPGVKTTVQSMENLRKVALKHIKTFLVSKKLHLK